MIKKLIELYKIRKYELDIVEDELSSRTRNAIINSAVTSVVTLLISFFSGLFSYMGTFTNNIAVLLMNNYSKNNFEDVEKKISWLGNSFIGKIGKFETTIIIIIIIITIYNYIFQKYIRKKLIMERQILVYSLEKINEKLNKKKSKNKCKHFVNVKGKK